MGKKGQPRLKAEGWRIGCTADLVRLAAGWVGRASEIGRPPYVRFLIRRRASETRSARTEIAVEEGRRFGKRARRAFDQSIYSVESACIQNSRSAASVLKTGIGFRACLDLAIVMSLLG